MPKSADRGGCILAASIESICASVGTLIGCAGIGGACIRGICARGASFRAVEPRALLFSIVYGFDVRFNRQRESLLRLCMRYFRGMCILKIFTIGSRLMS